MPRISTVGNRNVQVLTPLYPGLVHPELSVGLIGAWSTVLGNTGSVIVDRTGRGNHAVLTNMDPFANWLTDPLTGQTALEMNPGASTDDFCETNWTHDVLTHFTYICWFRLRVAGAFYGLVDSWGTSGGTGGVLMWKNLDEKIRLQIGAGSQLLSTSTVVLNTWTMAAVSQDNTLHKVYFNAKLENTAAAVAMGTPKTVRLGDASRGGGTKLLGMFKEGLIYNRALSQQELDKHLFLGPGGWADISKSSRSYRTAGAATGAGPIFKGRALGSGRIFGGSALC